LIQYLIQGWITKPDDTLTV